MEYDLYLAISKKSFLFVLSLFQAAINTDVFNAWMIQDLISKLSPKSVVVIDNATFHQWDEMKESLEKAGHELLYLTPYSPDLNPVEHKWAQAKALRRKNQSSIEALFNDLKL